MPLSARKFPFSAKNPLGVFENTRANRDRHGFIYLKEIRSRTFVIQKPRTQLSQIMIVQNNNFDSWMKPIPKPTQGKQKH